MEQQHHLQLYSNHAIDIGDPAVTNVNLLIGRPPFRLITSSTYYYNIFANVYIWTHWGSRNNWPFANKHMITDVQWEKCYSANGKQCKTLKSVSVIQNPLENTHPELNCLNGGRTTAFWLITQYRPVLTFAKSPRIIAPVWTITLPFNTIFCDPHSTVFLLTLFPEA